MSLLAKVFVSTFALTSASFVHAQLSFTTVFLGNEASNTAYQNATTAALNSLASNFTNNINLRVEVTLNDLGNADTLGESSAQFSEVDGFFHTVPLYNVKTNTDLAGTTTSITIAMNTNAGITWGLGTGLPGSGVYSWQSVVMHEALHSMGFYDGVADETGALAETGYNIFDTFVRNSSDVSFTSYTTNEDRLAAITSNDLFWTGAYGVAANGGFDVKLYSPGTFESGSTYSHIDPSQTGAGGLLFPTIDDNVYFSGPTAIELGIMRDIGWSISAVPEPGSFALLIGLGALMMVSTRRRQRS